jgi:DNA replication protein DnaC
MIEQTYEKMNEMRLGGMVEAASEQAANPSMAGLSFEERLTLIVDREWERRQTKALRRRLSAAKMREVASVEDVDLRIDRGLDRGMVMSLFGCGYLGAHTNIIITGPTGVGKTYLACALANKACRTKHSALYARCTKLLGELAMGRADGRYASMLRKLARVDLLILDDWCLCPIDQESARDLFELIEERSGRGSNIIISQQPVASWHDLMQAPTIADAILDRLIHNAYRLEMKGESMRKKQRPLMKEGESD